MTRSARPAAPAPCRPYGRGRGPRLVPGPQAPPSPQAPPPAQPKATPIGHAPARKATPSGPPHPALHSRLLQAVRGAQHPLWSHQDAAAQVSAVHLHRRHVGPRVGLGLLAAQDPAAGLRRCGGERAVRTRVQPPARPPRPWGRGPITVGRSPSSCGRRHPVGRWRPQMEPQALVGFGPNASATP